MNSHQRRVKDRKGRRGWLVSLMRIPKVWKREAHIMVRSNHETGEPGKLVVIDLNTNETIRTTYGPFRG